LTHTV